MKSKNKASKKAQYIANRKQLIEMSKFARMAVKEGIYDSVNEALKESYMEADEEIWEFKTFNQWKQEGATVKKGSKAYLVWGQPRQVSQAVEGSEEPEEFKYWPVAYLFANSQVYQPAAEEPEANAEQPEPEQEPAEVYEDSFL